MSNPYGAPTSVYEALMARSTDLLRAIRKLGSERVQWSNGQRPKQPPGCVEARYWSAWNLDGAPARVGEIVAAAKWACE